jgi:hypothetical protein
LILSTGRVKCTKALIEREAILSGPLRWQLDTAGKRVPHVARPKPQPRVIEYRQAMLF